jgi:hypothetical protein
MAKLFWFPTPSDSGASFRHDTDGVVRAAKVDTHPKGRLGISWDLPDSLPDRNGARIITSHDEYYDLEMRGVVDLHYFDFDPELKGLAGILIDDVHLVKKPAPCPEPPIPPIPPGNKTPIEIINAVYATGKFNLATKDGCGQFTEACVTALHDSLNLLFGHLQKIPPQNHYPEEPYVPGGKVHAVDALQLLVTIPTASAGVYDIIRSSESPEAEPAFNFAGPADPSKFYYPAK